MSKKTVYVEDVFEALKELTAKEESYVDPFASVFKMIEYLPPACCSDCIANGGDFECDRVNCHKCTQPSIKMSDSWRDELITKGAAFSSGTFNADVEKNLVQWYDVSGNKDTTATGVMFTLKFDDGHDHLMRWAKTKIFALPPEQPEKEGFSVIDVKTGEEADTWDIALNEDWAKHLMYCDMEGFAIEEDGTLILLDECGQYAYCPIGRFDVRWK